MSRFDRSLTIKGLHLKNPLIACSGTYGFGDIYTEYVPASAWGGIAMKGITPQPRLGNPAPRLRETPAGLLNAVGLENPGLKEFRHSCLPGMADIGTAVIVNISGFSVNDFKFMASRLDQEPNVDALEVNISCPNIKHGGMQFGSDPDSAAEVVRAVRENTSLPLIVKLSPNVTDIAAIARAVVQGGADAVSLINTLLGMSIDIETQKPFLGNTTGGLSGPAVRPVAVRMVYETYKAVDVPIIGMGGITCWQDAVEFMLAGASAVGIGTANFTNPLAPVEVLEGIEAYAREHGYGSLRELVGRAHRSGD
ncbi:MAG: dihydroorotate dehydrogenase [Peptococcaceae bacterium]|nr:dihydroorotate dehydrogenase [Peptococcaceae bacterium]